jgi:hypothetical protein
MMRNLVRCFSETVLQLLFTCLHWAFVQMSSRLLYCFASLRHDACHWCGLLIPAYCSSLFCTSYEYRNPRRVFSQVFRVIRLVQPTRRTLEKRHLLLLLTTTIACHNISFSKIGFFTSRNALKWTIATDWK